MQCTPTPIPGLFRIDIHPKEDARGFFARTWDPDIAAKHGLIEHFDYHCISGNTVRQTLRGMHWQRQPHGETKLVRCTKGRIFDVALDLRPDSPTFRQWHGEELTAENHRALYIPPGCAHGFLTLEEDTEVLYHIAGAMVSDAAMGARWDDPAFAIHWPEMPAVLSERDATYPDFQG